jgi:hypothetical protein
VRIIEILQNEKAVSLDDLPKFLPGKSQTEVISHLRELIDRGKVIYLENGKIGLK